jgi:hypothetical protein
METHLIQSYYPSNLGNGISFDNNYSNVYFDKYKINGIYLAEYIKQKGINNPNVILQDIEKKFILFKAKYDYVNEQIRLYPYDDSYKNNKLNLLNEVRNFERSLQSNIDELCTHRRYGVFDWYNLERGYTNIKSDDSYDYEYMMNGDIHSFEEGYRKLL